MTCGFDPVMMITKDGFDVHEFIYKKEDIMSTAEKMFCYQCEQTSKGEGCTQIGVCGKQPDVAALQDLLVYALKGLSLYALEGRKSG